MQKTRELLAQIDEVKRQLKAAQERAEDLAKKATVGDGTVDIAAVKAELKQAVAEQADHRERLLALLDTAVTAQVVDQADVVLRGGLAEQKTARHVSAAIGATVQAPRSGSIGAAFAASDEVKSMLASGSWRTERPWRIPDELKDVWSGMAGEPVGARVREPMVGTLGPRRRLRELLTVVPTTGVVEFFRVSGFTNAASTVPERAGATFGLKSQSDLTLEFVQEAPKTIAHWIPASRQALADEPQLAALIDDELLRGLARAEDQQILAGAGGTQDLLGLVNQPGIQTYTQSTGESKADAIRRARTLVSVAEIDADVVLVSPADWEDIELEKDASGRYVVAGSVADGIAERLWRLPVFESPTIPAGTALVASLRGNAWLYEREMPSIRISDQHDDFFVRNALAILAEERVALAVKRPEGIVKVTFTS